MRFSLHSTKSGTSLVLGLVALSGSLAASQMTHESGMPYDVKTEVALTGTVEDVMEVPGATAMSGTHLSLKTKAETIHVHLGPTAFVARQGVPLAKGDQVTVTGSRVKGEGFEAILARTVKKGDRVMTLRDDDGKPRWRVGR